MVSIDSSVYGPWAVIAGGSEGVGAAFADELAAAGINLVLFARKPGPLEQTAGRARERGVQVRTVALDLIAAGALDAVRAATADVEVGLFIFNAGANTYGAEIVEGDPDRFQQVIDLNIGAQLRLTQHFGKRLKDRGRGGIILLGSLAGYLGQPQIGVYSAAKAFDRILAESLWIELAPHGVHVLGLVLGVTRTPSMERAGLRMDLPGLNVAEPADVAREGLEHLADGPLWIAGGNFETARRRNGFGRAEIVRRAAEATRRLVPSR
ncbi:SDR family NAD(P)-dependent oxidoreductase [Jatrophihabitans cynanchi]|uniref:SDR family NAD(P)-dependent oxidoreductase n=1 Tax=Jatrophihabitans cynanchi TaxID=2944128 RepID=A0ABY7JVE9_9ACTN|nr:SDR family NAD(P)-dependent oxidoreductase [Jatrophihabitans sp. SB3-54]WAX56344.1 SDR family NAD(P)-dependent oxidoreductase [Jatrophihabitans sp. SB3-54]